MAEHITTARQALHEVLALVYEINERLETLESHNLHLRLKRAEELAEARAKDFNCQLLRLAEVVANLATR